MSEIRKRALIAENLTIALDVLRSHKMRSGLIILGVSIGVASLMGMVSIILGLKESITRSITNSEQTNITVMKFDFQGGSREDFRELMRRKDISEENMRAVRKGCPSLQNVGYYIEPLGMRMEMLRYGNEKSRMIKVVGIQPTLFSIMNFDLDEGRLFTDQEVRSRAKVVVIGSSPRRDLFPNSDPIGKRIKVGDQDFVVVGTVGARKTLFGDMANNFAMIPYTAYLGTFWKEQDNRIIFGSLRPGADPENARDEVIRVMRQQRHLKANQPNDFSVQTSDATVEMINTVTAPIATILAALSSIGLLVGGIGVMNMMLVSVTERTGEIGIRKAVGATRKDILWQFLIEAGTLTGVGGILGITLGLGAAFTLGAMTGLPAQLSVFHILLGVILSIAIGIFFGLFPASRASKLEPVKAMGYAK